MVLLSALGCVALAARAHPAQLHPHQSPLSVFLSERRPPCGLPTLLSASALQFLHVRLTPLGSARGVGDIHLALKFLGSVVYSERVLTSSRQKGEWPDPSMLPDGVWTVRLGVRSANALASRLSRKGSVGHSVYCRSLSKPGRPSCTRLPQPWLRPRNVRKLPGRTCR